MDQLLKERLCSLGAKSFFKEWTPFESDSLSMVGNQKVVSLLKMMEKKMMEVCPDMLNECFI